MKFLPSCITFALAVNLVGCGNSNVSPEMFAIVSSNALSDYLNYKYPYRSIEGESNNEFTALDEVQALNVGAKCNSLLVFKSKDVVKSQKEGSFVNDYNLTDSGSVDRSGFHNCIQSELGKVELRPEQLSSFMNLPQYKMMKATQYKPFEIKIDEIKKNGKFTALDGLEMVKIIGDYQKKQSKLDYQANIENL